MKKLCSFIGMIVALCPILASAKDIVVQFKVDETNRRTSEIQPMAVDANFSPAGDFILNEADSTFVYKNLSEDQLLLVAYQLGSNTYADGLRFDLDTITFYVPSFYLNEPKMLKEVTVTASDRSMSKDKDTYIPTTQNKRISANGTQLLQNIGITTLNVSRLDGTISTVDGQPVSTFIDFLPASRTDLRNIRAQDVKRVDVYDYPTDPRFGGAQHVVNFVMQQYEFGGYTKAEAMQYTLSNEGVYGVYSKFAYKKMVYDVGMDFKYTNDNHSGQHEVSTFRFPTQTVEYTRNVDESLTKNNAVSAFLRAVYQNKKITLSNTFSFSRRRVPDNYQHATETFSSPDYIAGEETTHTDNSSKSIVWQGNYQFTLPKGFTLVVEPNASYSDNDVDNSYTNRGTSIINLVNEKAWEGELAATMKKNIGKHSLMARFDGSYTGNDIDYGGTQSYRQKGREALCILVVQTNLSFGKLYVYPSINLILSRQTINDVGYNQNELKYYIFGSYTFNKKSKLTFSNQLYKAFTIQRQKTDFVQLQNQIFAISGNPDFKPMQCYRTNVNYTYQPINGFSATAYGRYCFSERTMAHDYRPEVIDGRDVMVRTLVNGGVTNSFQYGISANWMLLNNALTITPAFQGTLKSIHGPFRVSANSILYALNARYTFSKFYVEGYYQSKTKLVSPYQIEHTRDFYYLMLGWGNGNLQLSAKACNPFRKSYLSSRAELWTRYYDSNVQWYSAGAHNRFEFTATYSLSYGKKKVSKQIDTDVAGGPESQIMSR